MTTPRQLHDLPSLRSGLDGFVARRRRGRRRMLALGGLLALAGLALGTSDTTDGRPEDGRLADPAVTAEAAREGVPVAEADAPQPPDPAPTLPFAEVDGLVARLPSPDVLLVGYHEASLPGALAMEPVGQGRSNSNTTRITLPPDREDGAPYHVMSSRGRVHPPTSAVDIVMRDDDPVLAPVDGVVTEVRPYALYDQHPDTRIEIQPDDAPHLRVVLIHVDDVRVAAGDRVTTGVTELAGTANRFPFSSHVDRYLGERWPHVHMEVKAG